MRLAADEKSVTKLGLAPRGFGAPDDIEFGFEEWSFRRRNARPLHSRRSRRCSTSVHPTTPKGGLWPRL